MKQSKIMRFNEEELFYISIALQDLYEVMARSEPIDYVQQHSQEQSKKNIKKLVEKINKAREGL